MSDNNRLGNKITALTGTGSFWLKNMEETEQVPLMRALSRLTLGSSFQTTFEESVQWLAGTKEVLVENIVWQFREASVIALNAELNQRLKTTALDPVSGEVYTAIARPQVPDLNAWTPLFLEQNPEEMQTLLTEIGDFLLWPVEYEVPDVTVLTLPEQKIAYALPVPHGYTPLVITTETRELVIGLNYLSRDGFLVFFEPPLSLFPERNFVVRTAWKHLNHPHDFVWGVENI